MPTTIYKRSDHDRFWEKVQPAAPEQCWIWTGSRRAAGYGTFLVPRDGKLHGVITHRWAFEELVGPIPAGLELDHRCQQQSCVNPAHLEVVTHQQNNWRRWHPVTGLARSPMPFPSWQPAPPLRVDQCRTHCKRGHEYAVAGFFIFPDGRRMCAECHTAGLARQIVRKRERRTAKRAVRHATVPS